MRYVVAVLLLVTMSCQREKLKTAVARIDDQTLTLEDIRTQFDTTRGVSEAQLQQFIQRWLTDELLYREAVRRGMDQTPELNERMAEIRRQLAINALLEKEIYNDASAQSADSEVTNYFESHKREFVLVQDVALVSYVAFHERDAATAFRNSVLKGTPWSTAVSALSGSSALLSRIDSVYETQASLVPVELWRVASNASPREPSFPVNTSSGYCVLIVWKFERQGQPADLGYVEREIRGRLTVERRRKLYNALVENLRARHAVEVLISAGDSSALKSGE
ncbi:MAG TPA: peptidylprolyl isomerase [Bacteroidota bacterium]|nr:peptidylprolyl isomerase [Bacteroidota bacterium]